MTDAMKDRTRTTHETPASAGTPPTGIDLFAFSIVLVANANNPSIINQDFLLNNGIITDQQPLKDPPPISTPGFAQVLFEDGLSVKADPNRVIVEQIGNPPPLTNIVCVEVAKRYLKTVPHVPYVAVGINPKGYRRMSDGVSESVADALRDNGRWMVHKSVVPTFRLTSTHQYDDRRITLDISNGTSSEDGRETPVMLYQGNIHRDLSDNNQQMKVNSMLSILASWRADYLDYVEIVRKTYSST